MCVTVVDWQTKGAVIEARSREEGQVGTGQLAGRNRIERCFEC